MATKVSTPEASAYLDVPESTLRYWRHAGKGPASYVLGRKVFYDVSDLDHWMAAQKAATLRGGTA
jgi:Helix-turn-helix domain